MKSYEIFLLVGIWKTNVSINNNRHVIANVLICSWSNILDGRQWNLNVIFADQSSQLGSVTFVNTISVPLVLFQKMSLVIIVHKMHYVRSKKNKQNQHSVSSKTK